MSTLSTCNQQLSMHALVTFVFFSRDSLWRRRHVGRSMIHASILSSDRTTVNGGVITNHIYRRNRVAIKPICILLQRLADAQVRHYCQSHSGGSCNIFLSSEQHVKLSNYVVLKTSRCQQKKRKQTNNSAHNSSLMSCCSSTSLIRI